MISRIVIVVMLLIGVEGSTGAMDIWNSGYAYGGVAYAIRWTALHYAALIAFSWGVWEVLEWWRPRSKS